jgi:hypothetical protein
MVSVSKPYAKKVQPLIAAQDWINNILPGLIEGYEPRNILNYDGTGLFYKCLPGKFVFSYLIILLNLLVSVFFIILGKTLCLYQRAMSRRKI